MTAQQGLQGMHRAQTASRPQRSQRPARLSATPVRASASVPRSLEQQQQCKQQDAPSSRRQLLAAGLAVVSAACAPGAARASETFLKSTGARGFLSDEEEILYQLRQEKEGEARKLLEEERVRLERESKLSQEGKLCATPFGVDVVGISESVALIGALVGGISARQRKDELERLNEQLRKINLQLRQQARAGTIYAPGLTYAPPAIESSSSRPPAPVPPKSAGPESNGNGAANAAASTMVKTATTILSMEEDEMTADQLACKDALRVGKRLLKEKNGSAAMVRFEKALMLSKALADKVQERRASRGLAAAARLQSQYRTAIRYLERVLEISKEMKEFTGDADAYGTIADCYTDLGEFEKAATYYDRYIAAMDGSSS